MQSAEKSGTVTTPFAFISIVQNTGRSLSYQGPTVRIEKISSEDTIDLRHSVLWPEMPPDHVILPEDALGIHYGAFLPHASHPVAVISLFLEPLPIGDQESTLSGPAANDTSPRAVDEKAVRFRKFACDPGYQGRGLGTQLLLHALSMVRSDTGVSVAWCDARKVTEKWYRKRGFAAFGNAFFKGHVEYVRMKSDCSNLCLAL